MITLILLISNQEIVSNVNAQSEVSCRSFVIMDSSGRILEEKKSSDRYEVASICKLMTTLIVLEKIDNGEIVLSDKFVASDYACGVEGSQAFLDAGCEYTVDDLLKSVIIASANDSAIVLAEGVAGNENSFVELMNKRAVDLGMLNTLYGNSTGLSDKNQYSSAHDTAILLNEVSEHKLYQNYCNIWIDKLIHPSGRQTELVNTNRLIKYYPYCKSGKTGFTDEAGYCLSSVAIKDDLQLTIVVLGCATSADRFTDSINLYNYAFANYQKECVLDKDMPITNSIKVDMGKDDVVEVVPQEDFYLTLNSNQDNKVDYRIHLVDEVHAPLCEGDIVGSVEILLDNTVVGSVNLIANNSIDKQTYYDIVLEIINNFDIF